jgi:hypothetical protein
MLASILKLIFILFVPGVLAYIILLHLSRNLMIIRINSKRVIARAIEWASKDRKKPICFMLKCPKCHEEQWANIKHLYIGCDNTKNNYRCRYCDNGIARKRKYGEDPLPPKKFFPKTPGWRSIL